MADKLLQHKYVWPAPAGYESRTTYQSEVDYLINWTNNRLAWLDSCFAELALQAAVAEESVETEAVEVVELLSKDCGEAEAADELTAQCPEDSAQEE